MSASEVIAAILKNEGITPAQLAKDIGLNRPQAIYDIMNGKAKSITQKMATRIKNAKPLYDYDWLLTGNGQMIATEIGLPEQKESVMTPDSLTIINRLIELNAAKDEELRSLREELAHLRRCFEVLADRAGTPSGSIQKDAM
jgi:transcriptional regulator with XRE-family HTH domain